MKKTTKAGIPIAIATLLVVFVSGCAARQAPNFKGEWKAVNRFAETTEAIPMHRPYEFYASPIDKTLKAMLTRWAQDSNMTLSYLHPSDFTLHTPVSQLRTDNLQEAVGSLTRVYGEQQVSIEASHNEIVVRAIDTSKAGQGK